MSIHHQDDTITVHHGDCLQVMADMPDNTIDAIVTDPPYSLSFMSAKWDTHAGPQAFQDWCEQWATQALRVLKPGGHMLAFGGTRTFHRLTCAIEDAGFKIRDNIAWLYGQGFSKGRDFPRLDFAAQGNHEMAAKWAGWNVALKPGHEPIVVARKPLTGTVAQNVQAWGTGAINVDATRVNPGEKVRDGGGLRGGHGTRHEGWARPSHADGHAIEAHTRGRWPANVVLDDTAAAELDAESAPMMHGAGRTRTGTEAVVSESYSASAYELPPNRAMHRFGDSGGASRFFPVFKYQAKAPTRERPKVDGIAHPTCKPLELIRWLVRLVTPPGGTVLDPFAGSGTTAEACILEGFHCITIERKADYLPLIQARIDRARTTPPKAPKAKASKTADGVPLYNESEPTLFDDDEDVS